MKAGKEIAILIFVIAVLAFYISSEKGDKTHYELPSVEELNTDDISGIKLLKEGSEILMIRKNDTWLAGPQEYTADSLLIAGMLDKVSGIRLTALASESRNYSLYELDAKKSIVVEVLKGDTLLRKLAIGKPASSYNHTFVLLDDDYRVYHAQGNIRNDFDKSVADLRDKNVLTIEEDIAELTLRKGKDEITIIRAVEPVSVDVNEKDGQQKAEDAGPKWTTADGKSVKSGDVDDIIKTLSSFDCESFIENKKKEDLFSPVYTVHLVGSKTYSLSFFEKENDKYPALSSENDYPFLVPSWKADKIMKDPKNLLE
jgi:hypothetical protein